MTNNLIDTHAHIYNEEFAPDRESIIEKAFQAGVKKILMPNVDSESIDGMLELEEKYPDICVPMMGLHPCNVGKNFEKELYIVEDWLNKRKFIAVGEIGMDLYWDKSFQDQQIEALNIQVALAKKHNIPVVIHSREAFKDIVKILEKHKDGRLKGVFHCFSGDLNDVQAAAALDFYLGIGGVVTFKNGGLDKIIPELDIDRIVLETDCPYLSPVPHRGKRNEPYYLTLIVEKIASLKRVPVEDIAKITTQNANNLFRLNP